MPRRALRPVVQAVPECPRGIGYLPVSVGGPQLACVVRMLEPGPAKECERLGRLVRQRGLHLPHPFQLEPIDKIKQLAHLRKHAEEVESGAIPRKRKVCDDAASTDELAVT